jgi:hypothetical protein
MAADGSLLIGVLACGVMTGGTCMVPMAAAALASVIKAGIELNHADTEETHLKSLTTELEDINTNIEGRFGTLTGQSSQP